MSIEETINREFAKRYSPYQIPNKWPEIAMTEKQFVGLRDFIRQALEKQQAENDKQIDQINHDHEILTETIKEHYVNRENDIIRLLKEALERPNLKGGIKNLIKR